MRSFLKYMLFLVPSCFVWVDLRRENYGLKSFDAAARNSEESHLFGSKESICH